MVWEVWDVVDKAAPIIDEKEAKLDACKKSFQNIVTIPFNAEFAIAKRTKSVRSSSPVFDASSVDVYKDAHCCVFVIDRRKCVVFSNVSFFRDLSRSWFDVAPCRQSSIEYVRREMSKVPSSVSVILLSNFRDCFGKMRDRILPYLDKFLS